MKTSAKQQSNVRLTNEEIHYVQLHIINTKLQQQALLHANITYARFRNVLDHRSAITRQQYIRLMAFCKNSQELKEDF